MALPLTGCATQEKDTEVTAPIIQDVTNRPDVTKKNEDALEAPESYTSGGNYTDEMKIPYGRDLSPEDGADSVERMGDHKDSPYFSQLDFYNMKSTDTLTILENFKTIQQSSEWSCGVASILMVLDYFDMADGYDEQSLAELRPQKTEPGATSLSQAIEVLNQVGGLDIISTKDFAPEAVAEYFTLEKIQELLSENTPILVCWNDWGGHWQVIIGYDTMGTETTQDDVIIVADPYDTTDHNQDGYGVYPAERFYYNFTTYNFFSEEEGNDMLFIAVKPAA